MRVTSDAGHDVPFADPAGEVQELLKREFFSDSNEGSLKKAFRRLVGDQTTGRPTDNDYAQQIALQEERGAMHESPWASIYAIFA